MRVTLFHLVLTFKGVVLAQLIIKAVSLLEAIGAKVYGIVSAELRLIEECGQNLV